jgi:hypothetical protein
MIDDLKRWLFLSGPIGRLLQWAAGPGREIERKETAAFFNRLFPDHRTPEEIVAYEKLFSLQPCCGASENATYGKIGPNF